MLSNFTLCKLLNTEYPIIQGGMAWLGTNELVSAVSNAGGLGIIGSGNAPPDWLKEQIVLTKEQTNKPFGVNIMLLSPFLEDNLKIVIEEKIDVVTLGAGNPGIYIPALKEAGIKVIPVSLYVHLEVLDSVTAVHRNVHSPVERHLYHLLRPACARREHHRGENRRGNKHPATLEILHGCSLSVSIMSMLCHVFIPNCVA